MLKILNNIEMILCNLFFISYVVNLNETLLYLYERLTIIVGLLLF